MSYFSEKVVVITGGSEGIGKAMVDQFLQLGAKVATCGRNFDKLYLLQSTYPGKPLIIHTADVSKEQDCHQFINAIIKSWGTIDILINNAGVSMRSLVADVELDTIRKVMDINFWGTVYCTKFALPYILQKNGTVVGVSSIAGYRGLPGRSGYSASKYAVNGWLEALRTELLHSGTNIMWVCPGYTKSNIRNVALNKDGKSQMDTPMREGELMSAEDCAAIIIKGIEKRKRSLVMTFTGKRTVLMNKFFPSLTDKLVYKFFFKNGELV
ncbi:MAG: SDR family oxidoreductase [Chitinophagaceae bacterium]|nr:SDR family oxidoreductase [Chitinophagaceae bacterium]